MTRKTDKKYNKKRRRKGNEQTRKTLKTRNKDKTDNKNKNYHTRRQERH